MKHTLATAAFLATAFCGFPQTATLRPEAAPAEDSGLRAEAVRLLERANQVSTPAVWPPNQMTLLFHVGQPAPGDATQGEYISSIGGNGLKRIECNYGNYQFTHIRNGGRIAFVQPEVPQPAILSLLTELAPIYLVQFDEQDIIRSLVAPAAGVRCIRFDTVAGDRQQAGEICVDAANGWLLSVRAGDTVTANSEFFPFEGAFLPHHVERSVAGRKVLDIDMTISREDGYPPDFFLVPEDTKAFLCRDLRRPYAVHTPQPEPRTASLDVVDIKLLGYVDHQGRVLGLRPLEQVHPDLNQDAIRLVSTWSFTPATCGGRPAMVSQTFTVHFKGW